MKKITSFNQLLFLFLLFIGVMIIARIAYAGNMRYIFLVWNLFLAWIPYVLSGIMVLYQKKEKYKQAIIFISWLLFFPNGLYIITDLIHLRHETNVPLWYDAALLYASSFAGLMMAFISLFRVENYLNNVLANKDTVRIAVPCLLFLGAFGVYLGRFGRWNSWNVVNDPLALGMDIFSMISSPVDNAKVWGVTIVLSVLYSFLYFIIKIIPGVTPETASRPDSG